MARTVRLSCGDGTTGGHRHDENGARGLCHVTRVPNEPREEEPLVPSLYSQFSSCSLAQGESLTLSSAIMLSFPPSVPQGTALSSAARDDRPGLRFTISAAETVLQPRKDADTAAVFGACFSSAIGFVF